MTAQYYIEHLHMQPHPEGGSFVETYRSARSAFFSEFEGERSYATSIFFLLEKGQVSSLHSIKSDELWYHQDGGELEIIELDEQGEEVITRLGKSLHTGAVMQHVVTAGRWFGARPAAGADFVLVGCEVTPGFDFRDFELKA